MNREDKFSSKVTERYSGLHRVEKESEPNPLRFAGFGIELCGVCGLLGYGGYWAGQKLGHSWPWLMVIGLTVGFVGMFILLLKETGHWRH